MCYSQEENINIAETNMDWWLTGSSIRLDNLSYKLNWVLCFKSFCQFFVITLNKKLECLGVLWNSNSSAAFDVC
jgi:hypothetical protein